MLETSMTRWLDPGSSERILSFASAVARAYAQIAADRRRAGQTIGEADCQIAAISCSRGAVRVTRNMRVSPESERVPERLHPVRAVARIGAVSRWAQPQPHTKIAGERCSAKTSTIVQSIAGARPSARESARPENPVG